MNRILKTTIATVAAAMALGVASAPAQAGVFITTIKIKTTQATWLQVAEVEAFSGATNVALAANGGFASATSTYDPALSQAFHANDGSTVGDYHGDGIYHGADAGGGDVLTITFAGANISSFTIFGRTDCCNSRDTYSYELFDDPNGPAVASGFLNAQSGFATAALPEPSTWALMLMGFGMVGYGLRRRQKQTVRVTYA